MTKKEFSKLKIDNKVKLKYFKNKSQYNSSQFSDHSNNYENFINDTYNKLKIVKDLING